MKLSLYSILLLLSIGTLYAQTDNEVFPPVRFPSDRYEEMAKRSPFVLPTFEEEIRVTTNWASDYCIVSVLKIGPESVVIAKKISTDERIPIRTSKNAQGIRLLALQSSSDPHEVSAHVEMEGEEGTLQYDPAILSEVPRSVAPNNPAVKPE